ncbi:MAG: hypothetical protein IJO14_01610 [Clostridia bacterium]|nr:hypothetical protein [Clostridia bacterium]
MDTQNQKKMYTLFIIIVVILLIVSGLVGAAIAVHFNNNDKEENPGTSNAPSYSSDVVNPSLNLEVPTSAPASNVPTSNATVEPSNNVPTAPSTTEPTEAPTTEAAEDADKVGPYATGTYYVAKTDGKNLRLRASASSEVDTGVEIPANSRLTITQIIASDDPAYPYWGATTYGNTAGYVAMQFLTDAATFEADNPTNAADPSEEATTVLNLDNVAGNYAAGSYMVSTGGNGGVKVKTAPGSGDGLAILADGTVVEVLDVQQNAAATAEDTVYWGHIQWQGWDAYVPMYYLTKAA